MSKEFDKYLVYVKKHYTNGEVIIAICDYELLGERIVDEEKNITVYIDPDFYKGELITIEKALKILREASIANLFGKNIVEAAINEGLLLKENVIEISGIPHAQLIVLEG